MHTTLKVHKILRAWTKTHVLTVYQSEKVSAKLYIINHTQYYGYLPQHTHTIWRLTDGAKLTSSYNINLLQSTQHSVC